MYIYVVLTWLKSVSFKLVELPEILFFISPNIVSVEANLRRFMVKHQIDTVNSISIFFSKINLFQYVFTKLYWIKSTTDKFIANSIHFKNFPIIHRFSTIYLLNTIFNKKQIFLFGPTVEGSCRARISKKRKGCMTRLHDAIPH